MATETSRVVLTVLALALVLTSAFAARTSLSRGKVMKQQQQRQQKGKQTVYVTPWGEVEDRELEAHSEPALKLTWNGQPGVDKAARESQDQEEKRLQELMEAQRGNLPVSGAWKGWDLFQHYFPKTDAFRLTPQEEAQAETLRQSALSE